VHEIGDQRPLTVGSAVSNVIVGVDDGTAAVQCRRHMGVPAAVLGVAMDDLDDPHRRPVRIPPSVEDPAFGPLQKSLSHGTLLVALSFVMPPQGGAGDQGRRTRSGWPIGQ
jgi:hypothetical protein